jgi:hypothetical protein
MADHDSCWKLLFSHRELVADWIRGFAFSHTRAFESAATNPAIARTHCFLTVGGIQAENGAYFLNKTVNTMPSNPGLRVESVRKLLFFSQGESSP